MTWLLDSAKTNEIVFIHMMTTLLHCFPFFNILSLGVELRTTMDNFVLSQNIFPLISNKQLSASEVFFLIRFVCVILSLLFRVNLFRMQTKKNMPPKHKNNIKRFISCNSLSIFQLLLSNRESSAVEVQWIEDGAGAQIGNFTPGFTWIAQMDT